MCVSLCCCLLAELECSVPVAPANGGRTYTSRNVGSSVRYHCNSGHRLVGEHITKCENQQGRAVWSGPPPKCEGEEEVTCLVKTNFVLVM